MSDADALEQLRAALPGRRVLTDAHSLDELGHDRSHHAWQRPLAVVRPQSTAEVSSIVAWCFAHDIPVVPRGAGTGLEGGANACAGCIVLDLRDMRRIVAVHAADLDVVVEAGALKSELNAALAPHGLFFPGGPGVDASVGGMISTRASGTNAVRYGTMREQVMALTVVLADGRIVRTGSRTRKSAAGYDLTHLIVGAEGTLGIVTEATLRVYGIPAATAALVCAFDTIDQCTAAVYDALKLEIPMARIELIDAATMAAINAYRGDSFAEAPTLMIEVQGNPASIEADVRLLDGIVRRHGAVAITSATEPDEVAHLWAARTDVLPATAALVPGASTWSTDVCVPISRLAECIAQTQRDVERSGILAPIVGHVGDGNFHLAIVLPEGDGDVRARASEVNDRLVRRALAMDGTCSGEHGIGVGKLDALALEHGDILPVMAAIKTALDPHGILNPGVMVPIDGAPAERRHAAEPGTSSSPAADAPQPAASNGAPS